MGGIFDVERFKLKVSTVPSDEKSMRNINTLLLVRGSILSSVFKKERILGAIEKKKTLSHTHTQMNTVKRNLKRLGSAEKAMLSLAYRRNRRTYVTQFKLPNKFRRNRNNGKMKSNGCADAIYDVANYPLTVSGKEASIFQSNQLILKKTDYAVKGGGNVLRNLETNQHEILNGLAVNVVKKINNDIISFSRKIAISETENSSLKLLLIFLLHHKFVWISYKVNSDSSSSACVKLYFSKATVSNEIPVPSKVIDAFLPGGTVESAVFYNDDTVLPEDFHQFTNDDTSTSVNEMFCILKIRTEPTMPSMYI